MASRMRVIDQFDIHLDVMNRWDGMLRLPVEKE